MLVRVNADLDAPAVAASPVEAADAGDAAAAPVSLDAFLAEIGPRAFRFAEAGLRQREDALDAVQDAMMKMLRYRTQPPGEWTPLFWSILRRRIVDLQRRRLFRLRWMLPEPEQAHDIDWIDGAPDPSRQHDHREGYARLAAALRALPARQREAFTLRVLEQLDVGDTARAMGCSEGSVKTHLFRARETLRQQLEDFR